jgi:Abnormal spindle-like microcephaly-assoc'd, ASPM-SPD-2-Hydin
MTFFMRKNLFLLGAIALFGAGIGYAQTTNLSFSYQVTNTPAVVIGNGGTVQFPDTAVGAASPTQVVFSITNNGTAAVSLSGFALAPSTGAFQVSPTTPLTLPANGTAQLTLAFAPSAVGTTTPTLSFLANTQTFSFTLSGTGVGPTFVTSYSIAPQGNQLPLNNGSTITFPTTPATTTSTAVVSIANTGTGAGTVNAVSITGQPFYSITGLPLVPATVAKNSTFTFNVVFKPTSNQEQGKLTIDLGGTVMTISLAGTPPVTLPSFTFTGSASSTANPLDQPTIGVHLSAPYSVDLTGTVQLTFVTNAFTSDPTVQFSTGGQNVGFRIPAGSVDAIFQSGGTTVGFQAGTVAGVITLTPAFQAAQVDVTPLPAVKKTVTVAASAPVVRNVQIANRTATTFDVQITGLSTPRSVTAINLTFGGAPGGNLQTTSISVNADAAFTAWYQTAASQAVGSQFTVTLTITVNGSLSAVQSVSASLTNSSGTSNSMTASL